MQDLVVMDNMKQDFGMKDTSDIVELYRIGSEDHVDVSHMFVIT